MSSKPKKLPKHKKNSERVLNKRMESPFVTTPPPSVDASIFSSNRPPSTGIVPKIVSTTNSSTPTSTHSKETFTPTGARYHSKTK